jgi:hypothetical protein
MPQIFVKTNLQITNIWSQGHHLTLNKNTHIQTDQIFYIKLSPFILVFVFPPYDAVALLKVLHLWLVVVYLHRKEYS